LEAFAVVNEALDTVQGRSGHGYLVTQCRRAVSSAVSNIAEGAGRAGRDRAHFFQIAYGSAVEASSQFMQLQLLGLVASGDVRRAEGLLDRVRAMLWRLIRSPSTIAAGSKEAVGARGARG
jgi:four helix bundle protein